MSKRKQANPVVLKLTTGEEKVITLQQRHDGSIVIHTDGWDLLALLPNGKFGRFAYVGDNEGFAVNGEGRVKQDRSFDPYAGMYKG
jgi:hypothetical protein